MSVLTLHLSGTTQVRLNNIPVFIGDRALCVHWAHALADALLDAGFIRDPIRFARNLGCPTPTGLTLEDLLS